MLKIKCINADRARNITTGKIYKAKQATHSDYWSIKNDNGDIKSYIKWRFEIINDNRRSINMDYKYIRAWGKMMKSYPYYIESEVEKARKDKAPQTATYRRQDGTWSTFEEIKRADTKERVRQYVEEIK